MGGAQTSWNLKKYVEVHAHERYLFKT